MSALPLGRIGLGTAALGHLYEAVSDDEAEAVVHAAWAAGIRFFDTAHLYGGGLAETRLGRALRAHPRTEYEVATKIGNYRPYGQGPIPPGSTVRRAADVRDYSAGRTEAAVAESLQRLGVDHIDIVHVHGVPAGDETARTGAFPALARLRDAGTIGAVGAGTDPVEPLVWAVEEGLVDAVLTAGRHTLLDRQAETRLLPLAAARGVRVLLGGVFNSGILATGAIPGARFDYEPASPQVLARARRLEAICAEAGIPLRAAALQFPLREPRIERLLIGPASVAELEDCLAMLSVDIPADVWEALEAERAAA